MHDYRCRENICFYKFVSINQFLEASFIKIILYILKSFTGRMSVLDISKFCIDLRYRDGRGLGICPLKNIGVRACPYSDILDRYYFLGGLEEGEYENILDLYYGGLCQY